MIRMTNGSTRIGSVIYSPESGAFSANKEIEARLVSLNVAEYTKEGVLRTPDEAEPTKDQLNAKTDAKSAKAAKKSTSKKAKEDKPKEELVLDAADPV